ncbi:hypothetical protein Hamer_G005200 [Homarus americanus]|uniref:Uncharacterized protein n=1 Tax=Homarus americanus TaxID=6706 RepID=A0A8J5MVQ2_HOMAM|nr:hypothetical protein Hamer_G005200 [Homarus americanus]
MVASLWRSPPTRRVLDSLPCLRYLVPQSPVLNMLPLTSVAVVFFKELLRYSEEKLVEELRVQKVVKVDRFHKKENGALNSTPSLLLTFDCFEIPTSIKVALALP